MEIPDLKPGQWLVIRIDGTEEPHGDSGVWDKPTIGSVKRAIGAECLDSVTLNYAENGEAAIVMLCDDTGMLDHKPVNSKATALYHARCKPGTIWAIHGDVAICNDGDFA